MSLEEEVAALRATVTELTGRLGRVEDAAQIRALQYKYSYYMDKFMFDEIVELFTDDAELRFMGGIFRGKAGAKRLYGGGSGLKGPVDGLLYDHHQIQDIIDVAPDGKTAKGRFRCFLLAAAHESKKDKPPQMPQQFWDSGVYENEFRKEDGVWKISLFNYNLIWQAHYQTGPAHTPGHPLTAPFYTTTFPENPRGPDELMPEKPRFWPQNVYVPFHYPNPVTGKWRESLEGV